MKIRKPRKPNDWGVIFRNALARGDDHGYAAYLADAWEARHKRKQEHEHENKIKNSSGRDNQRTRKHV